MDGRADTIMVVLRNLCSDHQLNMDKLAAFGSYGAAVMMGNQNGVAAQPKQVVPLIIANHCVPHRFGLATAQAADKIPYIKNLNQFLTNCIDFMNILQYVQLDSKKFKMSSMTQGLKSLEPKMFGGCLTKSHQ